VGRGLAVLGLLVLSHRALLLLLLLGASSSAR
jgi:hypothetical protein